MRSVNRTVVRLPAAAVAAFLSCVAGSICFGAHFQYSMRLLLPPSDVRLTRPTAINNAGVIVGGSPWYSDESPAVRWDAGASVATRLNGLGGVNYYGKTQDAGWGINDSGAIVGEGLTADGKETHGLRWDPGATVATDIGGGGPFSEAFDINNAGAVVGRGYLTSSIVDRRPVYWAPGATAFTGLPGGGYSLADCHVYAINDAGISAGEVQGYAGPLAVAWSPPYTGFAYLPSFPGQVITDSTQSTDINASGMIVGYVSRDSGLTYHGFRYDPASGMTSELLGRSEIDPLHGSPSTSTLSIFASAVNANGVAVGKAGFLYHEHAVTWLPNSNAATDLNSLIDPTIGWTLVEAYDINDVGQIIGRATGGGVGAYYVLTPVPEPAALGLALGSFIAFGARVRRESAKPKRDRHT